NSRGEVSSHREKSCPKSHGRASAMDLGLEDLGLEIDAEYQSRLVALEINEIEGGAKSGRSPPNLSTPGGGQPRAIRQLKIGGWTDKQGLTCELFQTDSFIFSQIARFTAEKDVWAHSHHHPE